MADRQMVSVGIDLGGTSIRVGLFDASLHLLASRSIPTAVGAGPQVAVEKMARVVRELLAEVGAAVNGSGALQVLGIGIGSPGPINLRTGVLGLLPNLPGWDYFPLRDRLADATQLPVTLESDANAAAIAEWKEGAGKATGLNSMAMLTLGTGVGSGLILAGQVWHGMFGMGGEVGHVTVDPEGLLCGCGSRGCLEMYGSASGVLRLAQKVADSAQGTDALRRLLGTDEVTTREIADAAEAGDPGARLAFEHMGHYLGLGIASLINTLDLPMIVVGGGVASAWPWFADAMFQTLREYSVVYRLVAPTQRESMEVDRTFVRPALLGPAAGLIGAALLPVLGGFEHAPAVAAKEVVR